MSSWSDDETWESQAAACSSELEAGGEQEVTSSVGGAEGLKMLRYFAVVLRDPMTSAPPPEQGVTSTVFDLHTPAIFSI